MSPDVHSTAGSRSISRFRPENPVFACVISYTATSEIPGITVAGANPDLIKYTSAADAEFLYYGRCRCIKGVPATPDGKPTPAIITRTALSLGNISSFIVDAGAAVKPSAPVISLGLESGRNIAIENAMVLESVHRAYEYGQVIGKELAHTSDLVIVGESIPGGTTTALAVLTALGADARFKVSSSMPENPHMLKNSVVESALSRSGLYEGSATSPFDAVACVGDPMIPSVAGIAKGALGEDARVMLAGGTQMTAAILFLKRLGVPLQSLCVGTTSYLLKDSSSDLAGLIAQVAPSVPILSCDLRLGESVKPGLRAFAHGFVKEGVGAGGASIAAMLKSKITGTRLMKAIEKQYELTIEKDSAEPGE